MSTIKKLIEVSLPLEAINKQAAREKSIRHGHPSTLHLWWARRPLAACRAVLFSSLVDDPSSHPEKFPTAEAQELERERLFKIIEELVNWDNIGKQDLYDRAYKEILASTNDKPPPILDPFAGGGSIPLEAQRLGLEAHASDLNPVAVLINKALIEIPPKFKDMPPVNTKSRENIGEGNAQGAVGLAEDVKYYGAWMRQKAFEKIGHLYPKVTVPATADTLTYEATVIAWIWARTVQCPNPACGAEMPLVHSFELSKKKGTETWIKPLVHPDKKELDFEIHYGKGDVPVGTVNRNGARCPVCGEPVGFPYIREEGKTGRMGARMMAIVADGTHRRVYLPPNGEHIKAADVKRPQDYPDAPLPHNTRDFKTPNYGLLNYADLFTPRQLNALTTFSDLVGEAITQAEKDALAAGLSADGIGLDADGNGAKAYGEAVGVYLACAISKGTNMWSSICSWMNDRGAMRETFARQAIPMVWDFAEANPFSDAGGNFSLFIERCADVLTSFQSTNVPIPGIVKQQDASKISGYNQIVISTDPPYYDNIGYADLSDFFYIWLRRCLNHIYPKLFSTILVPKKEELVATPYRFTGGKDEAKRFFEDGMLQTFIGMRKTVSHDYPLTVYYAFKQSETTEDKENKTTKTASTGWETMLEAIIKAGFSITGTWPLRTESQGRAIAQNTNALSSSIALVCRPRTENASSITRRDFIGELKIALKEGLAKLQSGNIAPVDLAQASIGPGMAVYSKYKEILEADGNTMSVRSALVLINHELDTLLGEEGNLDTESRFCIFWYEQFGLHAGKSGDADQLSRSKNANLDLLKRENVFEYEHGIARLKKRSELNNEWNPKTEKVVWTIVQHLCRILDSTDPDTGGIKGAAAQIAQLGSKANDAKALAYRAFRASEKLGLTEEAQNYNQLVGVWGDILAQAEDYKKKNKPIEQGNLDF